MAWALEQRSYYALTPKASNMPVGTQVTGITLPGAASSSSSRWHGVGHLSSVADIMFDCDHHYWFILTTVIIVKSNLWLYWFPLLNWHMVGCHLFVWIYIVEWASSLNCYLSYICCLLPGVCVTVERTVTHSVALGNWRPLLLVSLQLWRIRNKIMFAANFSCHGKTTTSWSATGCHFGIAAANMHKVKLCSTSNYQLWSLRWLPCTTHCSQGARCPSSQVFLESEWQPAAFDAQETFGVSAQLYCQYPFLKSASLPVLCTNEFFSTVQLSNCPFCFQHSNFG